MAPSAAGPRRAALTAVAAAMRRWWLAYINWRIEQAAIAALSSMGDRDLNDIGLGRSEITGAVKGKAARGHPARDGAGPRRSCE